jgi:hypothetical protein
MERIIDRQKIEKEHIISFLSKYVDLHMQWNFKLVEFKGICNLISYSSTVTNFLKIFLLNIP